VMLPGFLVPRPAIAEFQTFYDAGLLEKLDRAVDGGDGNRTILIDGTTIELVDIRMILRFTNDADDNLTLAGHSNAVRKAFFEDVLRHFNSVKVFWGFIGTGLARREQCAC